MKLTIISCFLLLISHTAPLHAQKVMKKIKETAKQTTEQKTEEKTAQGVSEGIDKGLDGIKSLLKKKLTKKDRRQKETEGDKQQDDNVETPEETTEFGVYSTFTFEPGNKILFYDDFGKDGIGDFPAHWETSGSGEVVTTDMYGGKWLSLTGRSGYLPSTRDLPENYTVEFDLVTDGFSNNNAGTALSIAFLKKKNYTMGGAGGHASLKISLHKTAVQTVANTGAEKSPRINTKLDHKFKLDQLVHVSMAVNKNRLRIWMGEEKIVDLPSLLVGNMGRYILLEAFDIKPTSGHSVLISNFKIAESSQDLRSQLLQNGRFSTTGIYFNTDKADIKPESFAVIKSVADYLGENPEVRLEIIGHTDSQGEEDYNQYLSLRRAKSVIHSLVSQFGIDESRLSGRGKGESEPVDDNSTENGRANNRRVEFVKV